MRTTVEEYVVAIHSACNQHERDSRSAAQDRLRNLEREQSAQAARERRSYLPASKTWRSMPIVSRPVVAWETMPLSLRIELATIPERYRLDVAASALLVLADHAEWPMTRIVKRAKNMVRDELRGRYDAGVSRRSIGKHETSLTERHARDLASSVAVTVSGGLDARAAVTAALVRSLPHGETILAGLMAGETQSRIAEMTDTPTTTLSRWLARIHDDAIALLS